MAYLPSSQAFLEQSCLLLAAYPDTVCINYIFPLRDQYAVLYKLSIFLFFKPDSAQNQLTQDKKKKDQDNHQIQLPDSKIAREKIQL